MKKSATYAVGILIGMSASAMTQPLVAGPLALNEAQMDSITAGDVGTEVGAFAAALGQYAITSTNVGTISAVIPSQTSQSLNSYGQAGTASAVAIGYSPTGGSAQGTAVHSNTQTPFSASVGGTYGGSIQVGSAQASYATSFHASSPLIQYVAGFF